MVLLLESDLVNSNARLTALLQEGELGGLLQMPGTVLDALSLECLLPCVPPTACSKDVKDTSTVTHTKLFLRISRELERELEEEEYLFSEDQTSQVWGLE